MKLHNLDSYASRQPEIPVPSRDHAGNGRAQPPVQCAESPTLSGHRMPATVDLVIVPAQSQQSQQTPYRLPDLYDVTLML